MADSERFHYPQAPDYTGLIQYCIDRRGVVDITSGIKVYGTVRRGEVVKAKQGLAERLVVRGGDFSHVAANTPEGQPTEYRDVPPKQPSAEPAPAESTPLSAQIRASMKDRSDLTPAADRRLRELADAAESTEQITDEATEEIRARTAIIRSQITDEWRALIARPENARTE